jgi:maltooligosyltrehalose synthase
MLPDMKLERVVSIIMPKILSTLTMSLMMKLADRKMDKGEFKALAEELVKVTCSALNDYYQESNGERPIQNVSVEF